MNNTEYARILSKGKSIEVAPWCEFAKYTNDCFKQSIISYKGALLLCIKTHVATAENAPILLYEDPSNSDYITGIEKSEYWKFLLTGPKGTNGKNIILKREDDVIKWGYDFMTDDEYTVLFTVKELSGTKALHVGTINPIDYKNQHLDDPGIQAQYEHAEDMIWEDGEDEDPADEMYSVQEIDEKFKQQEEGIFKLSNDLHNSLNCPPDNEIWYETENGESFQPEWPNMLSQEYNDDLNRWVVKFEYRIFGIGPVQNEWSQCERVTKIWLPNCVEEIYENAFDGFEGLKQIQLGDKITNIESFAFANCLSLTTFSWPATTIEIPNNCFNNSGLRSINIPKGVIGIYSNAFQDCFNLQHVIIPDSVRWIRDYAFCGIGTNYEFGDQIQINIGKNIQVIDDGAFVNIGQDGCEVIFRLNADNPPTIESETFLSEGMGLYSFIVPAGSRDKYLNSTNWCDLGPISSIIDETEIVDIKTTNGESIFTQNSEIILTTKDYVDTQIGNINTILETIITG